MTLGPSQLLPLHRSILRRKTNRIVRKKYHRGKLQWSDKALSSIKAELRHSLRMQQEQRCYFCRRIILTERKNAYEAIEHYLDKSKKHYHKWAFSPVNLTLCCHACNFQKSTKDLGDPAIQASVALHPGAGSFRWLHPYFDDYHASIEIKEGWVYSAIAGSPKQAQAQALISECCLDRIETIEAHRFALSRYKQRIIELSTRAIDSGNIMRARKLLEHLKQVERDSWKT